MTSQNDPTTQSPAEQPPVPDPSRPALPPITRVNSRILYAAAIFGLLVIWVITFTVTSRHPPAKPPAPPQTQDASPNLDSLASLAERVRASEEMRKKIAAADAKRAAPFDPFRGSGETNSDLGNGAAAAGLTQRQGDRPSFPAAQELHSLPPARYMQEPARPQQPAPGPTRFEQALAAPPLIAPTNRALRTPGSDTAEPGTGDPTGRLVDLLARHLPSESSASGEPRRPAADPFAAPAAGGAPAEPLRARPAAEPGLVRPQNALSPYVLYEGTILPAVLTSEITSELPGIVTATLRDPVYDSPSGHHMLLPPGTRALGRTETSPTSGEARLLVSWHRLILPDGRYFEIPLSAAADVHGATGLLDKTDRHLARAFTSTLLLSILGAGAQLSQPSSYGSSYRPPSAGEIAAGAMGQQVAHLSSNLLERDLQVKPTLTIRPGTAFGIVLQTDLAFAAPYFPDTADTAGTPAEPAP
jgi:type IV secretory pathway VirB10-like protein